MSDYIHVPNTVKWQEVVDNNYTLSSAQYVRLVMPNGNYKLVSDFLVRPLNRKDLGVEVGSINYIEKSPYRFIRTKALQEHSFLPDLNKETALPIMPSEFVQMNLNEGDLLISKDSNIGEIVILDKDYPQCMLSGAIYRLPVKEEWRYYLLAFIKHKIFREQLDFMVPKGATIRHAKTKFLNCQIPLPNIDAENVIRFISLLTQSIVNKEKLIRMRHEAIFQIIEKELKENQKPNAPSYKFPTYNEVKEAGRLDTGIYSKDFYYWNSLVKNYVNGSVNLIKRGFTYTRGTSLEQNFIKTRIDSDKYIKGFYELILPTNISKYGFVEKSTFIGTPTPLKTIKRGDIIFGGEGFGKGRTFVVVEDSRNVATNYHGIRIINTNNDIEESIFIRCFLAFWREKGMIDNIGVGGSGGHCSPSYFHKIETPLFPDSKQKEIVTLYYNYQEYDTCSFTLDNFGEKDDEFNSKAGIYELDKSAKILKRLLDKTIDDIVNDRIIDIRFDIEEYGYNIHN